MKRWSMSQIMREIITVRMRYHFIPVRMAIIEVKTKIISVGEDVEILKP